MLINYLSVSFNFNVKILHSAHAQQWSMAVPVVARSCILRRGTSMRVQDLAATSTAMLHCCACAECRIWPPGGGKYEEWPWWWQPVWSMTVLVVASMKHGRAGGGQYEAWLCWWWPVWSMTVLVVASINHDRAGGSQYEAWPCWWRPLWSLRG